MMRSFLPLFVLACACAGAGAQTAATNNMTYQARVHVGGVPANGTFDIRVSMYNAAAGGSPVGLVNCFDNRTVTDGLVMLTFNPGSVLDGRALYMELEVREDSTAGNCSAGAYSVLSPRQPLTAAPLASALVLPALETALLPGQPALIINNASIAANSVGIRGASTASSGDTTGVQGINSSDGASARGVVGELTNPNPGLFAFGVLGRVNNGAATTGTGVMGVHNGTGIGVRGTSALGNGVAGDGNLGVYGLGGGGTNPIGVRGASFSADGIGVKGEHGAATGTAAGVHGQTGSTDTNAVGVIGYVIAASPGIASAGVKGINQGTNGNGAGVEGFHFGLGDGVFGRSLSGRGVLGDGVTEGVRGASINGTGVRGEHTALTGTAPGVWGTTSSAAASSAGVRGEISSAGTVDAYGVHGSNTGQGYGVFGESLNGVGVRGYGLDGGVLGEVIPAFDTPTFGVKGVTSNLSGVGVKGEHNASTGTAAGVWGKSSSDTGSAVGVLGELTPTVSAGAFSAGVKGVNFSTSGNGVGVYGQHNGSGYGVYGTVSNAAGFAGYFNGKLHCTGALTKGSGAFRIDHPLDPANKYLQHSFVESPDMMNIYNGVVTTDAGGYATVAMPEWFSVLNAEFRYQLTVIDEADGEEFVQAKVVKRIADNQFTIRSSRGGTQVSWQVTGVRIDPFARDQRIQIEVEKSEADRGRYLYPKGYGKGAELQEGAVGGPPAH